MAEPKTVDVDTFVGNLKFSAFHFWILFSCTVLMMVDGYELYTFGWILPKVAEYFHVKPAALTSVLVFQQVGMVSGAFLISAMADKLGRQKIMLVSFAGVAISSLACAYATSVPMLIGWRVVAGFFGSAMVPILVAIGTENAPKHLRATFGTILVTGTLGGSLIGSAMQAFMLDQYGWQSAFWLGAIMPALLLPIIIFAVPETLRFLVARNPDDKRIPSLVRRMDPKGEEVRVVPVVRAEGAPAKDSIMRTLFGEGRWVMTALLWLAFMSSFAYISAGNWRTTLYHNIVGLDFKQVALAGSLGSFVGVVGNIVLGIAIDRWGFLKVLPTAFGIAAVSHFLMGVTTHELGLFFTLLVISNFFQHGSQAALAALASVLYPSGQSATGVGWAYGAGRIASIFAPLMGTFALSQNMSAFEVFALFSVPLVTGCLFSFMAISIGKPMRKPVRTGGH